MSEKKRTTVWIDPPVLKELKLLGVLHEQPIGNVIEALVDFSKSAEFVSDPKFRKTFAALLEMAFANAGGRGVWEGDPPEAGFDAGQGPNGNDLDEG
jgi:hypothetical protein